VLIGHQANRAAFQAALRGGRLHHAWLLAGPRGVGKRLFADMAARRALEGGEGGFEVGDDAPAARLLAAGSHPDFRVLEREVSDKGVVKSAIVVDQVRALAPVLRGTPGVAERRVIVVDAAEDMNTAAANALLKSLEEPPPATLFLLVSHAPSRLLPTIRSRCRTLRFAPLARADVLAVLEQADVEEDEREALADVADGRPGVALSHAGSGVGALARDIDALLATPEACTAFAASFGGPGAGPAAKFEALCAIAATRLADAARRRPGPDTMARAAEGARLAGEAGPLQLDRPQAAYALAALLTGIETPALLAA
jgi:DNA polymerase-3 subunit delta'